MAFLDDIIKNLNADDTDSKDKEKDKEKEKDSVEEQEQGKETKKRDSLITYSDKFYQAFEK